MTQVMSWKLHLPHVKPYYAIKSNPDQSLIGKLSEVGFGFDCASAKEIDIVRGVNKEAPIVYANPCKKGSDIVYGNFRDITRTVVDSKEEIDKLHDAGWKGDTLLRVRVEDSQSKIQFSRKFGANIDEIPYLARYAYLKSLKISGFSFHVGSGGGNSQQFYNAIKLVSPFYTTLLENGHYPTTLDVGGGFTKETFYLDARYIRNSQRGLLPNISIIGEPGRFFSETSHDLFVQVIGKKAMGNGKSGYRYTIDESLYGQFSCIPFDHAKPTWVRIRSGKDTIRKSIPGILYGRTCDSVDMIAAGEMEELMEGDWLWFPNMGAYTSVTSSEFNGFPKPPVHLIESSNPYQLPYITELDKNSLPINLKYVSSVKVPELS
jgi:ornithine decarboxylase